MHYLPETHRSKKFGRVAHPKHTATKPRQEGTAVDIDAEECECECTLLKSLPIFRLRFWKILFLAFLAFTTVNFLTTVLKTENRPSFLVSRFFGPNNTWRSGSLMQKIQLGLTAATPTVWRSTPKPDRKRDVDMSANETVASGRNGTNATARLKRNDTRSSFGVRETLSASAPGSHANDTELKLCPPVPPDLEGHRKVTTAHAPSLEVQADLHKELRPGGRFKPADCRARDRVAIIIPFRDRASHLAIFLYNIHPFLQKQQIDYAIYIIEQKGKAVFNRAMLLNIGYLEALKLYPYDCFIFHDIDLIPEDDRNLYTCPLQPRHMSVAINTMNYRLIYEDLFGGVSALSTEQFRKVNGFSNRFWGWGGEDDDMSNRIKFHEYHISRYPSNIARYTMISHKKDKPNPLRFKVLNEGKKYFDKDGLNNIKYKVLDVQLKELFTWITVQVKRSR